MSNVKKVKVEVTSGAFWYEDAVGKQFEAFLEECSCGCGTTALIITDREVIKEYVPDEYELLYALGIDEKHYKVIEVLEEDSELPSEEDMYDEEDEEEME